MLLISINYFRRREYRAISYDANPDACTTNILMTQKIQKVINSFALEMHLKRGNVTLTEYNINTYES